MANRLTKASARWISEFRSIKISCEHFIRRSCEPVGQTTMRLPDNLTQ